MRGEGPRLWDADDYVRFEIAWALRHGLEVIPVRIDDAGMPHRDDLPDDIGDLALKLLEDLGMVVLLPEARAIFAAAGARTDEESGLVRIGREIVTAALATAPRVIPIRAANPARDLLYEDGALIYYSCRTDDGRLFEFVDADLRVIEVLTIDALVGQWQAAAAA